MVNLSRIEQHIKRPAIGVGLPGAAVGPTLCNRDGQEHFLYSVLEAGADFPPLHRLRLWCPVCRMIHLTGGEPLRGQSRLGNRHGHSTPLKPFFTLVRRGLYEDTTGRFRAEQIRKKLRVTDQRENKVIGSPRTMTGAVGLVSQYLAREKGDAAVVAAEAPPPPPSSQPSARRKPRHSRPQPQPFNTPRLIQQPAGRREEPAPVPHETPPADASLMPTAPDGPEAETGAERPRGEAPGLPRGAGAQRALRSLLVEVMRLADGDGVFSISTRELGQALDFSRPQAKHLIQRLRSMKVIDVLQQGGPGLASTYFFVSDPYALLERLPFDAETPAPARVGEFKQFPDDPSAEETGADPAAPNHDPAAALPGDNDRLRTVALRILEAGEEPDTPDASILAGRALARLTSLEEVVDGMMMDMPSKQEVAGVAREAADAVAALMRRIERREAELDAARADISGVMDWLDKTFGVKLRRAGQ